ncbi:hypothetical protein ACC692_36930, partial [Rhizobium ruizarguesonis]
FSHAISKAAKSKIAITFFRRALIHKGFNPDALKFSDEEALLDTFGRAIVADSNAFPAKLWAELKERYETKVLVDLDDIVEDGGRQHDAGEGDEID